MPPPSHYDLLELSPLADEADVRQAYRRQAQKWHPDRNGGTLEASERFMQVRLAYEVLSSPSRRREYDEQLFEPPAASPSSTPPSEPAPPSPDPGPHPTRKGDDLHVFSCAPLRLLVLGGQVRVRGRVGARCPHCLAGCRGCGYSGQVLVMRRWVVDVPRGHPPDQWLRFSGAGHSGPFFSSPGDVLIQLRPRPAHGWSWSWERSRLERTVRVPKAFLVAGGLLEFRAPDGTRGHARVPAFDGKQLWLFIQGPGLGAQGHTGAWMRVKVGPWFSWGTRRFGEN